jgi:hypothetical protein
MNRTAEVAYAPNRRDNLNRLRVPDYAVTKLVVKTEHRASKSHQPDGASHLPSGNDGADDFHFAPEKEVAQIVYQIFDPLSVVRDAKLELYARYQPEPLWALDLTPFGPTWWRHGEHAIAWDGRLVKADRERDSPAVDGKVRHAITDLPPDLSLAGFPDGYVNLEHTTYKLKLTLRADDLTGDPAVAWTFFHVLVDKIELEFGPPEALPVPVAGRADHRAVRADLVSREPVPPRPSDNRTVEVFLDSDIYRHRPDVLLAEQGLADDVFEAYRDLWGDGPLIPLLAKVRVRDSNDHGVDSPKAIGGVRFLWEWESMSGPAATGKPSDVVVNRAQDSDLELSKPRGRNCHVERGGKRGNPSVPVFPAQAGYHPRDTLCDGAFPFKVEAVPEKRRWAAQSYAWRDRLLAGKTGVLFQPSRMAGDAYKVSVYLVWDVGPDGKNRLDTEAQPLVVPSPERVSASTGVFQIWRRVHLREHVVKQDDGMPDLDRGAIAACFRDACLEIAGEADARRTFAPADWDAAIASATAAWDETSKLFLASGPQHEGAAGVVFRSRDQLATAWKEREIGRRLAALGCGEHAAAIAGAACAGADATSAHDQAMAAAGARGFGPEAQARIASAARSGWERVETKMSQPPLDTAASYAMVLQEKAIDILTEVFRNRLDQADGITVFQVAAPHNLCGDLTSVAAGVAQHFPALPSQPHPRRCGFLLMCPDGVLPARVGLARLCARGIGDHLFLAHDESGPPECLMSPDLDGADLCGLCQLRLRGYSKDGLCR